MSLYGLRTNVPPRMGQKVQLLTISPVPLDVVDVVTNTGNHSHEEYHT